MSADLAQLDQDAAVEQETAAAGAAPTKSQNPAEAAGKSNTDPQENVRRPSRLKADSLADGVFIVLSMLIIQRAIGFGRGILFCRWLDPAEFGQWGLAFNFLLLAAPIAVLGLPGSYGRYLEHYRQKGQLAIFLRRTTLWTALLAGVSLCAILIALPSFSRLIFGEANKTDLVAMTAVCLAGLILHHFLESLYMALRMNRVVSGMQFFQSIGFAIFGGVLLWTWRMDAASLVLGYSLATLLSALGGACWLRGILDDQPENIEPIPQRTFWGKLLPFAMWVWMANLLANLFAVVDRYMLVHHSGLSAHDALIQVGYYQSSLIVPVLLVSVADLFASILTPHLSQDWERGEQDGVAKRLNLAIKIAATVLVTASTAILLIGPILFHYVLQGKYTGGLEVLPLALVYSSWFGLTIICSNYLWCAERARLGSMALFVGLVANVGLNYVLLPIYGLWGAVTATTVANAITLGLTLTLCRSIGMRYSAGTYLLLLLPATLAFGPLAGVGAVVMVMLLAFRTGWLFNASEKEILLVTSKQYLQKVRSLLGMNGKPPAPSAGSEDSKYKPEA